MDSFKIFTALSVSHLRAYRNDDLWIDSLFHRYSVSLFTFFAVLITSGQYIGNPIDCWSPAEFKSSYEAYAETICWINGTFYVSQNENDIPVDFDRRYKNRIKFYQWTSIILFLQALFMYIPRLFWVSFNSKSGINIHNIVSAAKKYETIDGYEDKDKIMQYIINILTDYIRYFDFVSFKYNRMLEKHNFMDKKKIYTKRNLNDSLLDVTTHSCPTMGRNRFIQKLIIFIRNLFTIITHPYNSKNYLLFLYFLYKLIFLLNVCFQLYMLDYFIGNNFYKCGFDLVNSMINQLEWSAINYFPRTTLCEIYIREINHVHPYIIQCLLRINLFNEVIFIFVWFWLVALLVLIVIDIIKWSMAMTVKCRNTFRRDYILHHLDLAQFDDHKDNHVDAKKRIIGTMKLFKNFHTHKVTNDMILVLKIISNNTSSVTVGEIIKNLWLGYKSQFLNE